MFNIKKILIVLVGIIILMVVAQQCNAEPITTIKTQTEYIKVYDTITETVFVDKPIIKYVNKVKTIRGKDSVVYVSKNDSAAIKSNSYETVLKSNNSSAYLNILTTGELLEVTGVIESQKKIITNNITKRTNNSGVFLYVETSILPQLQRYEVGVDWQIKNKFILGTSIDYNSISKTSHVNVKVGIRIF